MDTYGQPKLGIVSGHGSVLHGANGRDYIDMLAGIAVSSLGQGHPAVVAAVTEQISTLTHVSNLFATTPVEQVAAGLIERFSAGDDSIKNSTRVFFCNSGAEANEAAFKLARLTGRKRILASVNGFHGRTMGSLAMTGQPDKRDKFAPLPGGVEFFPYGDIDYLTTLVESNPADTAAVILEPIQGETGVIPAPEGFLAAVRKLTAAHGILFVCDEVQTGVGRTGDFFAHTHDRVIPDVVTMAKGLGAGLPIGACLATGDAARLFGPGSHGTTFGGNPVACAAATAVLDTIDDAFLAEVRRKGDYLAGQMRQLDHVDHVRGRGLMLGVVLDAPIAKQAVDAGLTHGVILNAPADTVLRLVPPLVITDDEIDRAVERIDRCLHQAAGD
ncbi:acetylornithine transaminase [Corynebacterium sp. CCM 8862]|uniref:Acetylornithine aminotransferase n=2 Tax=Corynebacterium mendelii TaxID=2765362 RepID=A0A939E091_9CORY|nr:acetylornithine transaminase [Corynebacterium mendelii]